MDRKLIFDKNRLDELTNEFNRLSNQIDDVIFEIWTEIPENIQRTYYDNEVLINPVQETYEQWQSKLIRRPDPLYSVALINNKIVSSVYSAGLAYERSINLWVTNLDHRQRGIGKVVLLSLIIHSFENYQKLPIKAWDVTSQHVDDVLKSLGFE